MEKEYAKIGNIVRIVRLYDIDKMEDIKIGDMFTITRVTSDVYGHKSGTSMTLSQLELVKQETLLAQMFRERYDLVNGDRFRLKSNDGVWEMIDSSFYEDGIFTNGNKMFDKAVIEILNGEREIEKITESILVEVIINGKKFKVTKEVESKMKALMD